MCGCAPLIIQYKSTPIEQKLEFWYIGTAALEPIEGTAAPFET